MGARNVRPLRRRPPTIAPVCHLTNAPVPAAYVLTPAPVTFETAVSDHPPVSTPVVLSNTSPELGKLQVSPVGKTPEMELKKARIAARAPDTESRE